MVVVCCWWDKPSHTMILPPLYPPSTIYECLAGQSCHDRKASTRPNRQGILRAVDILSTHDLETTLDEDLKLAMLNVIL